MNRNRTNKYRKTIRFFLHVNVENTSTLSQMEVDVLILDGIDRVKSVMETGFFEPLTCLKLNKKRIVEALKNKEDESPWKEWYSFHNFLFHI